MPPSDKPVKDYLDRRAITGPWVLEGSAAGNCAGAIVIPALAEKASLFATLASLSRNPPEFLARVLVVVVVNHRADASTTDKEDNEATLRRLRQEYHSLHPLQCAVVDAATTGRELPLKGGGVGMARKLGLDLALPRLDYRQTDPLLICLDADTLVDPNYLPAIFHHFRTARAGGAVIDFRHQEGKTIAEQCAIDRYELFLRSYVLGLQLAGSPYAFHTVGSAMACSASAYVKMGGMNTRSAAEDFYFLQQLHRTSGVEQVAGTTVHPSPRSSHRVPFGTGRSVSRLVSDDPSAVLFYHPDCFRILGQWLALAAESCGHGGKELCRRACSISPALADYLESIRTASSWDNLRKNHPHTAPFFTAFHGWFDGLKTMKLIHHLSDALFPRGEPEAVLPLLLERAGETPPQGTPRQLALLRARQSGRVRPTVG